MIPFRKALQSRSKPGSRPPKNTGQIVPPQRGIWSDLPLSTGIATLVCYAGVFNDVIGIEELASRLGISGQDEFYAALDELHRRGALIVRDGFAALPNLEDKIGVKAAKIATAHRLIKSRLACLKRLGKNPLIRFVGISGSLAADNPTRDRNNHLDIDVFLITRNQCLWLYNILHGIRNLFPRGKQEPELCICYVIDGSNLMIPNRNLYTATEIRNLIPISGIEAYWTFLRANSWADYFYPGVSGIGAPAAAAASGNFINKCFYVLYTVLRSIKRLDLRDLGKMSFKADPRRSVDFRLVGNPYGGYQALVQNKFSRLAGTWFPGMLDAGLIERLFPDDLSREIRRGDVDVAALVLETDLGFDYSKYG